jgi:hypothetical protein
MRDWRFLRCAGRLLWGSGYSSRLRILARRRGGPGILSRGLQESDYVVPVVLGFSPGKGMRLPGTVFCGSVR